MHPTLRFPLRRLLACLLVVSPALALPPESTPPTDGTFDVYIAAGQSNMAAIAAWTDDLLQSNPRAHFRRRDVATTWSHIPPTASSVNTAADLLGSRTASGSYFFGWDMARARPDRHIGVINLAVSGSSLSMWKKGGGAGQNYYADILAAVTSAQAAGGIVRGLVWHQGEASVGPAWPSGTPYGTAFTEFITDLRTDTGLGNNLRVVAGTLNRDGVATSGTVNQELAALVGTLPDFALVATRHRTMGDNVHFDGHTQHELGSRYSAAMRRLEGTPEPLALGTTQPTPATIGTWFELPHWWQLTGGHGDAVTWEIVGALPSDWTTLGDNKYIGGPVTSHAPFAVTVRATDSSGSVEATYTIQPGPRPQNEIWISPTEELGYAGSARTPLATGKRALTIGEFAGNSNTFGIKEVVYLKFDLSALPANILSAHLDFEVAGLNKFYNYTAANQRIAVRAVASDTWTEASPAEAPVGAELTTLPITALGGAVTGPVSLDVTSYIQAERSSDQTASVRLSYDRDTGYNGGYLHLYSRRGLVPVRLRVTVPVTYSTWTDSIPWSTADPAPTADPDADTLPNLIEYALGQNPTTPSIQNSTTPLLQHSITPFSQLQLSFTPAVLSGLTYLIQSSPDLATWTDTNITTQLQLGVPFTYTDPTPVDPTTPKRFLRLRVSQ